MHPASPKQVRVISAVICLCLMLGIVFAARIRLESVSPASLLYFNDRPWSWEDRYPLVKTVNNYLIPISLLAQLPNVTVRSNTSFKTVLIQHGEYYLSFNTESKFAINQNYEYGYQPLRDYYGEWYLPVEICSQLNIGYEILVSEHTGETAIRVCDGSQQKTFEALLTAKNPAFLAVPPPDTTLPPDTTPPDTTVPPPVITDPPVAELGERTIYLTFEDAPGPYTGEILDVLSKYRVKATFFIIGSDIVENLPLLSRILAEGHTLALHTMEHDGALLGDTALILADMEKQNALFEDTLRFRSRIWRAPEGSALLPALDEAAAQTIREAGYFIWDWNVDILPTRSAARQANDAIDGIWDNETAILRLRENKYTAAALTRILDFISANQSVCEVRTVSPAQQEYNKIPS